MADSVGAMLSLDCDVKPKICGYERDVTRVGNLILEG